MKKFAFGAVALIAAAGTAAAQVTLVEWDVFGQPGTQVTQPATFSGANVTGVDATRFGNSPSTGGNSFSGNQWSVGGYFAFGLTIAPGFVADLDTLYIGTRSSNTGPGLIGLYSSVDGFAAPITTIIQPVTTDPNNFVNSAIDLSGLGTVSGNIEFRIVVENNVAANGGTLAGTGAFRITNYFQGGSFDRNWGITGTVIPAPGAVALAGIAGLVGIRRRRA